MAKSAALVTAINALFALAPKYEAGDTVYVQETLKGDIFGSTGPLSGWFDMDDSYRVISGPVGQNYIVRGGNGNNITVPFYCLTLARKSTGMEFSIGDDYTAVVAKGGKSVEVGCQFVKFEEVKSIYDAMLKAQAVKPAVKKVVAKKVTKKK